MKVAMLTYSTRARGGVAHALKLAERLKSTGTEVTIYSLARSDDASTASGFYREVSVPYRVFAYEWHPDIMTRLERMIEAYVANLPRDADIYHSQDCVGGTSLMRMKSDGLISAPVFRTIHHIDDFAEPGLFEFEKRAVAHADHRFVVSKYWRDALKRDFGYDSTVVYNGLDASDFSRGQPRRSKTPTVLFVGGLEPRKGLEYAVLAMPRVLEKFPNSRLVVVGKSGFRGTDDPGWFKVLANRAGIEDSVEMHESVSQEMLMQLYSDCDVLVLPSRNEGWGLSLMEAMAFEKPVVATRVGGIPELVTDGKEGFLVDNGDITGLADAVARLLGDPTLRAKMGQAGLDRIKEFSWDEAAKVVHRAYESALRHPSRSRP
jgi:glycosyltransferase involved in cell wall biosynthesis